MARNEIYFPRLIAKRKFIIRRGSCNVFLMITEKRKKKSIQVHFKAALRTSHKLCVQKGNENLLS